MLACDGAVSGMMAAGCPPSEVASCWSVSADLAGGGTGLIGGTDIEAKLAAADSGRGGSVSGRGHSRVRSSTGRQTDKMYASEVVEGSPLRTASSTFVCR